MKYVVMLITALLACSIPQMSGCVDNVEDSCIFPTEIRGKLLNKDGEIFGGEADILYEIGTLYTDMSNQYGIGQKKITETKNISDGIIYWKGKSSYVITKAKKEGYHSTEVYLTLANTWKPKNDEKGIYINTQREIISKDIVIYLIPKGKPSTLYHTESKYIPTAEDKKYGGKQYGWSLSKRWYYPIDGEEPVDIFWETKEDGKNVLKIRGNGGFVFSPPYYQHENDKETMENKFEYMTEAPETGYLPEFDYQLYDSTSKGWYYCYFRTPEGKYGKILIKGNYLEYYIQPDGSRNLEAGEVEEWDPIHPGYREWEEQWSR